MTSNPDLADRLVRLYPGCTSVALAGLTGDLDFSVTPAVRRRLMEATGPQTALLLIDLDDITLLSAAAIGMLVDVVRLAADRGTEVRFIASTRVVLRPMTITGDVDLLPLFPSQAAALGA